MLRSHGSKISGSQQTVVLQKWWKKLTCMTFLCMIVLNTKWQPIRFFLRWTMQMFMSVKKYFCCHGNAYFQTQQRNTEIYQGEASAMQTVTQAWF